MSQSEADRYYGEAVANYDAKRRKQRTWRREHGKLRDILSAMPSGLRVLDVPVGTGRFFTLYKGHEMDVVGIDISEDMISASCKHAAEIGLDTVLKTGSIFALPFGDDEFDLSVSVRMMQWLSSEDMYRAIGELARVTNGTVILTAHHRLFPSFTKEAVQTRHAEQEKERDKRRRGLQVMTRHRYRQLMRAFNAHDLIIERQMEVVRKPGWYSYNVWVLRNR